MRGYVGNFGRAAQRRSWHGFTRHRSRYEQRKHPRRGWFPGCHPHRGRAAVPNAAWRAEYEADQRFAWWLIVSLRATMLLSVIGLLVYVAAHL